MTGAQTANWPGIRVRKDSPRGPSLAIDADASLVQLHRRLLEAGLDAAVLAALCECPGDSTTERRASLRELGVDALNGPLAASLAKVPGPTWIDDWRRARDRLASIGTGTMDTVPTGRDDVHDVVPTLLAAAPTPAATPTVTVRLGIGWAGRPREQRADVLKFLAHLGTGVDLVLVATDAAASRILDTHRDVLPAHCLTSLRNQRRGSGLPSVEQDARQAAVAAREDLSPSGRPTGVLRHLRRSSTHSLTYDRLASLLALDSAPYEAVRRLEADHSLVERTERADGATVVSLRPAGLEYLRSLESEHAADGGLSPSSPSGAWSSGPAETGGSGHPQNRPDMPCYPPTWDSPPGPGAPDGEEGDRPPSEAASAADGDRRDRYQHGLVEPAYAARMDWIPATEAVETGEISLVDVDLDDRLDDGRDGRRPLLSYDAEKDAVYCSAEYHNPMQSAVTLAHGLTCEEMWSTADWASRIGDDLRGLDISERDVLWSAVCMGWLPDDVRDGEDCLDELRGAREQVLQLATLANDPDSEVTRSVATATALGLVGTIVQLFDLLGVDVVLEERVTGDVSQHYGEEGNPKRRKDLLEHLFMLSALSSRVGAFSAFRQLFEDREDRRSDAFSPGFESGDSPCKGSMKAGITVIGDGVEGLAGDLRDVLQEPSKNHDDAPPISVPIDVLTGTDRDRFRTTVHRLLRSRNVRPTPAARMVLRAFVASPWAAAEAVHWGLEREDRRRDVHLDEIRRALSTLSPSRLLPDVASSARAGVAALLEADRPISQAELARRAGISTQSWRNHRDGLVTLDIVRETAEGWRVALPFRSERGKDIDVADPPWFLLEYAPDFGSHEARKPTDVLYWLAERGVIDSDKLYKSDDPIGKAFAHVDYHGATFHRGAVDRAAAVAGLEAAGVPPGPVLAGCRCPLGPPPTATLGPSTRQETLPI